MLTACAMVVACADEPEPRHPTHAHHAKKKHKKDDSDEVVVTDDSQDEVDHDRAKKHDVAEKDDDEDKRDVPPKKRKHSKRHDEDEDKQDESAQDKDKNKNKNKNKHDEDKHDEDKQDETKQDEAEAEPAPAPKPKPAKPSRRTSKRKTVAHAKAKASKTPAKAAVDNTEIEMDDANATEPSSPDADARVAAVVPVPVPAPVISPLAIDGRALVTSRGVLEAHGGLRTATLTLPTATPGMTTTNTSEALALGASYGIGDKAEIGADYIASLSPGAIKGPLTLHGAYLAVTGPKLDVAVAAALAIDFAGFGTTDATAYGLQLGAWTRYRIAPKLALFTGLPALPAEAASLSKLSFALPPLPYQLAIGLSSGSAIALDLPVGVGYQVSPAVYAFAMTNLAHLRISNTQTALLFADFIPVTVGGFYSLDALDLGATFADDLKQGTGYLRFELVARYAIH